MSIAATVQALALKTLVMAFGRSRECSHDDETGYTVIDGKTVHCKCGESFKVKCMHVQVTQLLPRVYQCVDCGEVRGKGEK